VSHCRAPIKRTGRRGDRDPQRRGGTKISAVSRISAVQRSLKYRGRRREPGSRPWQITLPTVRWSLSTLSSPLTPLGQRRPSVKLEPLSRRRPLSSTGAGGVEARSRCVHHSSTLAGPFDAVTDVRSKSKTVKRRSLTSSSGAWSSSRPFSPPPSPSSFASSPCCPPSH
jgi:hypothetical protein